MKKLLNDLYDYPNLKIYQYEEGFKFALDSILLAELVTFHKKDKNLLDLCTGNAVIPLILTTKTKIPLFGVELQKEICDLAVESVTYNRKENQVQILNENIKNLTQNFPGNNFDIITCNPPYFRYHNEEFLNRERIKQIARHEVEIKLEEIISIASYFLKPKGNFYLVHISERFQEVLVLMERYQMQVKDVYFVYPKKHEKSFLVLCRAIKGGNIGMKIHEPIYLDELSTYQGLFEVIK